MMWLSWPYFNDPLSCVYVLFSFFSSVTYPRQPLALLLFTLLFSPEYHSSWHEKELLEFLLQTRFPFLPDSPSALYYCLLLENHLKQRADCSTVEAALMYFFLSCTWVLQWILQWVLQWVLQAAVLLRQIYLLPFQLYNRILSSNSLLSFLLF